VNNDYLLAVGEDGAERLESVQLLYGEESQFLLKKAGLKVGMIVMDVGCGTGQMTRWLTQQVGDTGHVIAVDNNQCQLDYTKEYLDENNISNVSYLYKSINELSCDDLLHVDLIYSRLVLVHNKNPRSAIQNIKKNCKENTIFIFEEPITSESGCFPVSEPFNKHLELYCGLGKSAGFDYDFGSHLIDLIEETGLSINGVRKTKNYFSDCTAKLIAYRRTKECADKYLCNNMITHDEINILLMQLNALANNKATLISGVSMMQVWGSIR
jgi:SAM-dependent methyltransferase